VNDLDRDAYGISFTRKRRLVRRLTRSKVRLSCNRPHPRFNYNSIA